MASNDQLILVLQDAIRSGTLSVEQSVLDLVILEHDNLPLLHCAINHGLVDVATLFLSHGADPSQLDPNGSTALHYVRESTQSLVPRLLAHSRPDQLNHRGESAMTHAIINGMDSVVQMYIEANVSVNPLSYPIWNKNPYYMAIAFSRFDILDLMLRQVDKQSVRLDSFTPTLLLAITLGDNRAIQSIMSLGFNGLYCLEGN
jgi:ankyrin repeat protein